MKSVFFSARQNQTTHWQDSKRFSLFNFLLLLKNRIKTAILVSNAHAQSISRKWKKEKKIQFVRHIVRRQTNHLQAPLLLHIIRTYCRILKRNGIAWFRWGNCVNGISLRFFFCCAPETKDRFRFDYFAVFFYFVFSHFFRLCVNDGDESVV